LMVILRHVHTRYVDSGLYRDGAVPQPAPDPETVVTGTQDRLLVRTAGANVMTAQPETSSTAIVPVSAVVVVELSSAPSLDDKPPQP